MRIRKIFACLSLMLAASLAAPLSASAQETTARIGQATTSLSFLPIWTARALDTFKDQKLALQWAAIPGGDPASLAALDSGDIDFAAVGSETALRAIAKGRPFQLIYPVMGKLSLQLVVSNKFLERTGVSPSDPVEKRIAALKGATLGVSAVKGAQDRVARWLVSQGGLDPQSGVKVALIGPPPALRAALRNEQIDGFLLSPPEGPIAEQRQFGKVLISLGDEFPKLNDFPFLVLVAKKPLEGEKHDLAVRTVKALIAASNKLGADTKAVADAIQTQFYEKVEPEIILTAVKSMADGIKDPHFTKEQFLNVISFASETGGGLELTPDEGAYWTNKIVDEAMK